MGSREQACTRSFRHSVSKCVVKRVTDSARGRCLFCTNSVRDTEGARSFVWFIEEATRAPARKAAHSRHMRVVCVCRGVCSVCRGVCSVGPRMYTSPCLQSTTFQTQRLICFATRRPVWGGVTRVTSDQTSDECLGLEAAGSGNSGHRSKLDNGGPESDDRPGCVCIACSCASKQLDFGVLPAYTGGKQ